jgi:hypothetical protein
VRPCGQPLRRGLGWLVAASLFSPAGALAQSVVDEVYDVFEPPRDVATQKEGGNFVAMPIPVVNPTVGAGAALVGMLLYELDEESPPSSTAIGAAWTNRESWAAGIAQNTYFAADKFRFNAVAAYFDANLKFWGRGTFAGERNITISTNQSGVYFRPDFLWQALPNLFIGPSYRYLSVNTRRVDIRQESFLDFPLEVEIVSSGPGAQLEYDTRDNPMNSRRGTHIDLKVDFSERSLGADTSYQKYQLEAAHFFELSDTRVLAARANLCRATDGAPFYDACFISYRGYVATRFLDNALAAAELEFRQSLPKRFGFVLFGGVSAVADDFGAFSSDDLKPNAGVGLRWMASTKYGVNLSVDYGIGEDSQAWYFSVGESF